jgi:UDP-3-O-acyl N-acetylglucosamine deacetylase
LPGKLSPAPVKDDRSVKRLNQRYQRTIARTAEVRGIGFLTGKNVRLRFQPAAANTGVVFARTDLGSQACVRACVENVTGTNRRTTLGHPPVCVGLVEHVLAALHGLRIDNCYVELDAPEPPGLDGSALDFAQALLESGVVLQTEERAVWTVSKSVVVKGNEATLALHPCAGQDFRVSYLLDYGIFSPIERQIYTADVTPAVFVREIASCRTFLLEEEALELKQQGLGSRTVVSDLLVFGPRGPIENQLRFANEPARHKVLDILGDLALLGQDICGHVVAYRSGHPLNVELVRALSKQMARTLPRMQRAA